MSIELRAGLVRERLAVAHALPRVRRDPPALAGAAGREHDRRRREGDELAGRAPVAERAADALAVLEQPRDRALHEHVDARSARPCPGACGSARGRCGRRCARAACGCGRRTRAGTSCRSGVRSKTPPHCSSSRTRSGASLACSSAMCQLLRYLPPNIVSWKWTRQLSSGSTLPERRRDPALGHHRVRLAEQRLADERGPRAVLGRGDRRAQAGAARADHEHVVLRGARGPLRRSSGRGTRRPRRAGCRGRSTPTPTRLTQAHCMCRPLRTRDATPQPVPRPRRGRAREAVEPAADQVAKRVAAEREQRQQHDVGEHDQRAEARRRTRSEPSAVAEQERTDRVVPEEAEHDRRQVEEEAVDVLQDERERWSRRGSGVGAATGHRARRRREEERPVVRLAVVVTRERESRAAPRSRRTRT